MMTVTGKLMLNHNLHGKALMPGYLKKGYSRKVLVLRSFLKYVNLRS